MSQVSRILRSIRQDVARNQLLPGLMAGLIVSVLVVMLAISVAALVFDGDLEPYLLGGLASVLTGVIVLNLAVAALGSLPFAVARPEATTSVIIAGAAASIASALTSRGLLRQIYPTVLAFIVVASLLLGLLLLSLGVFRLGILIRFVPYPVIGGFLAGTAWLLAKGALGVTVDVPISFGNSALFTPAAIAHWAPGVALGVLLVALTRRVQHYLVLPAVLLVSFVVFYGVLWLTGTSLLQASSEGWLLGPFSHGYRWPPLAPAEWADINWSVLAQHTADMLTMLLLSTFALLFNATGLELALQKDINLDQELRANGWGNLVGGLLGGSPGYTTMSASLVAPGMGVESRLVPLTIPVVATGVLLLGANVLDDIPRFLLAGLLLFLSFNLLIDWVYSTWFSLPHLDWALLMLILVVIATQGLLLGIGVGVIVAMALFLVRYSQVNVVRNTLDGTTFISNRQRSLQQERLLKHHGAEAYILRLQNYLFFGTSRRLLDQIRERLNDETKAPVRFLVLDFERMVGMDSSAVLSFARLRQIAAERDITLILTHVTEAILHELRTGGQLRDGSETKVFPDLDRGVEWCENQILAAHGSVGHKLTFAEELAQFLPSNVDPNALLGYMERREVADGEPLIRQGAESDELYLIRSGEATVLMKLPDGQELRLRTMEPGVWVGELGFYLGIPRTASVVANEATTVYCLGREGLARMKAEDPDLAGAFHEMLARVLAERLANTDRMMVGLLG